MSRLSVENSVLTIFSLDYLIASGSFDFINKKTDVYRTMTLSEIFSFKIKIRDSSI